jgi:hypothetical protein
MAGALFLLSLAWQAQVSEDALTKCALVEIDSARLACFDRAAAPLREQAIARAAENEAEAQRLAEQRLRATEEQLERARREADEARERARAAEAALQAERARAGADQEREFGEVRYRDRSKEEREAEITEIELAVKSVSFKPRGEIVVSLGNGQVWEQLDSDNNRIRERYADRIEEALIKKGLFNSYRMTLEPLDETIRVRRVR